MSFLKFNRGDAVTVAHPFVYVTVVHWQTADPPPPPPCHDLQKCGAYVHVGSQHTCDLQNLTLFMGLQLHVLTILMSI